LTETSWHSVSLNDVSSSLETDLVSGLGSENAALRLAEFGPNRLTPAKTQGPFLRFLLQFYQPLVLILLAAAAVTLAVGEYIDAGVIFAVILANAIIGFAQESKALKAIDALARSMTSSALVVRDGERKRVAAEELVPGDIVILSSTRCLGATQ
jgi:Ca2+-transporting ATPase